MAPSSSRPPRRRTCCEHTGPAYVFENYQQMHDTIDSMDLPIDKDTVLVMKGCGPKGAPGFPEWGHIPMPKVLLERGVSDLRPHLGRAHERDAALARWCCTSRPNPSIGGPLAVGGDRRPHHALPSPTGRCTSHVPDEELRRRAALRQPAAPHYTRGYGKLFLDHVTQAHLGCDFDFLQSE